MTRAVFFDWFGTLARYDPPREELEAQVLADLGFTVPVETLAHALAMADRDMYARLAAAPGRDQTDEERARMAIRHQENVLTRAGISVYPGLAEKTIGRLRQLNAGRRFALYDDALPALDMVKERGLITGLLTNLERDMDRLLQELGLAGRLDFVLSSRSAGVGKPHPAFFNLALQRAGVAPAEALMVGDQYEMDVLGARRAGIRVILLDRPGVFPEVTDCPRIRRLDELAGYLT